MGKEPNFSNRIIFDGLVSYSINSHPKSRFTYCNTKTFFLAAFNPESATDK